MDIKEAMQNRHSVRQYSDKPLNQEVIAALTAEINACNQASGLHIQLVADEPKAFEGFMARYGKFSGVRNYLALVGKKSPDLDEKCGYYGERLVLFAQQLGLNTCWVGLTYGKTPNAFIIEKGEKLCVVIALGYGLNQGTAHKSKSPDKVMKIIKEANNCPFCADKKSSDPAPDWFIRGIEAALLAPTAMNQQKFFFTLQGNKVAATAGLGFYSKTDLGIAKYHFEIGAGKENFQWK